MVYYPETLIVQIYVMALQVTVQVTILGLVKPFVEPSKNRMEMLNEVLIMFTMYCMIIFTDFVPDVQVKFKVGYFECALITVHFAVYTFFILRDFIRDTRVKCLYCCSKKDMLEKQAERREKQNQRKPIREKILKERKEKREQAEKGQAPSAVEKEEPTGTNN